MPMVDTGACDSEIVPLRIGLVPDAHVVILGWAGSSVDQLRDVAQFYTRLARRVGKTLRVITTVGGSDRWNQASLGNVGRAAATGAAVRLGGSDEVPWWPSEGGATISFSSLFWHRLLDVFLDAFCSFSL